MARTLNVYVDMSESTTDEEWLPELAAELGSWLHGAEESDERAVRVVGFSHELADALLLEGVRPEALEEALGTVYRELPRTTGGTMLGPVWADAAPLLEAGEDAVVLTDMEVHVPAAEDGHAAHPLLRYRQYGVQNARQRGGRDERSRYGRVNADRFLSSHLARHGFVPPEVSLRSPREEERAAEARREREMARLLDEQRKRCDAQALAAGTSGEQEPHEPDSAEAASAEGFSGTLGEFLEWLSDAVVYGHVRVSEPSPDRWGRLRVEVSTVTGGFSSDEHLLARADALVQFRMAWRSSHAGGLRTYEFSLDALKRSSVELAPEGEEPHEAHHRVRRVRVVSPNGKHVEVLEGYADGVELWASEDPFDPMTPDGVLIIRPVPEERSVWR